MTMQFTELSPPAQSSPEAELLQGLCEEAIEEAIEADIEKAIEAGLEGLWEEAVEEQNRLRPKQPAPDPDAVSQDHQTPRPGRATPLWVRFAQD